MKSYFTEPPKPKHYDVPAYMYKRYNTSIYNTEYVLNLIQWAELEYLDTMAWFTNTFQYDKLKILKKYNWMVVLASTKEFKELVQNMTQEIWDKYPKPVKNLISDINSVMLQLQ